MSLAVCSSWPVAFQSLEFSHMSLEEGMQLEQTSGMHGYIIGIDIHMW